MELIKTSTVLIAVYVVLINTSPLPEDGEVVNVQLIRHQSDYRIRRDAGESLMPDVLVMQFPLSDKKVILRLKRSPFPPVFLVGKDGAREITGLDDASSAVYVDPDRRASFKVKRSADGQFLLDGNLHHQGRHMDMKPVSRAKRSHGNTHIVTPPEDMTINFENDFLVSMKLSRTKRSDNNSTNVTSSEGMTIDLENDFFTSIPEEIAGEGERRRKRRRTVTKVTMHTVETAFIIDHTDYAAWQVRFPQKTLMELRMYYTHIAQTMNNIYASVKSIDPSIDIRVPVTVFYIVEDATNAIAVSDSGQVEAASYLTRFSNDWLPAQPNLPTSDHYIAFTGLGLTRGGRERIVAYGRQGDVCTPLATTVIQNLFVGYLDIIAAHELAHSLNASHDGFGAGAACPFELQNVMSAFIVVPLRPPAKPRNIYEFSPCSVASFKSKLDSVNCTLPAATTGTHQLPFTDFNYDLINDRDLQCRLALNTPNTSFCDPDRFPGYEEEDICNGMLCDLDAFDCLFILPFEGTPCGTNKICFLGLCEDASTVKQFPAVFPPPTTPGPTKPGPLPQECTHCNKPQFNETLQFCRQQRSLYYLDLDRLTRCCLACLSVSG